MKTILLLGGATIHGPDGPVTGRGQRARIALLALLATSRTRSVSRERLVSLLWPDSETDRARHLLREALYRLRELLGEGALVATGDDLRLDDRSVACDVWQFEQAVTSGKWSLADRLYRGPFLEGLAFSGSAAFEQWLDAERARLNALHARALDALARELRQGSDWAGALAVLKRRAAADPFNSRVALALLETMEASGDRGGALRYAVSHAELLASELGAIPDADVTEFAERLRRAPAPNGSKDVSRSRSERLVAPGDTVPEPPPEPAAPGPEAAPAPLDGTAAWGWARAGRVVAALGAVVLLTAGYAGFRALKDLPPLDPDRIAILPLRTAGADRSLASLGFGFVELLSAEFNGATGPTAVEPGEVFRVWKDIDGETVTDGVARRVARALGAGQVAVGAMTGVPNRLIMTLRILNTADGTTRIPQVQVEGTVDDVAAVSTAMATQLLGRVAGIAGSESNDAVREYLAGMATYRRATHPTTWSREAESHFLRALSYDSTFIHPIYRLVLLRALFGPSSADFAGAYGQGSVDFGRSLRRLWGQRHVLNAEQRLLLSAIADSGGLLKRYVALARLERVIDALPNSAEAYNLLGDMYFHAGAVTGRENWAELARAALSKAVALDWEASPKAREHLADLAYLDGDRKTFSKYGPQGAWQRYQAAILGGEPATIRAARIGYARDVATTLSGEWQPPWLNGIPLPAREVDSLMANLESLATTPAQRRTLAWWSMMASNHAGRPQRVLEAAERWFGPERPVEKLGILLQMTHNDGEYAEQLARMKPPGKPYGLPACDLALARLRHGDTTDASSILGELDPVPRSMNEILADIRPGWGPGGIPLVCAQVLRGVLESQRPGGGALLHRADSIVRLMPVHMDDWNYDLGLEFARRGEYRMAASALRRYHLQIGAWILPRLVVSLREEGRWSAAAGDTASAIRAYRRYLAYRADPEPVLRPQRDSVVAELAGLEQNRRWRRFSQKLAP